MPAAILGHVTARLPRPVALALLAALAAALALAPGASAHGGGKVSKSFLSTVVSIEPALVGLTAVIHERDDRIEMVNDTGRTLTVLGYENEPYIRFTPTGVSVNMHSPAYYLNEERFGDVALPPEADAKSAPKWTQVTESTQYEWHDHRIHWMSTILPPAAQADRTKQARIFDWKIPMRADGGSTVAINGTLDYVPTKDGSNIGLILGIALPVAIVLLAGAATTFLVVRRRRAAAAGRADA